MKKRHLKVTKRLMKMHCKNEDVKYTFLEKEKEDVVNTSFPFFLLSKITFILIEIMFSLKSFLLNLQYRSLHSK